MEVPKAPQEGAEGPLAGGWRPIPWPKAPNRGLKAPSSPQELERRAQSTLNFLFLILEWQVEFMELHSFNKYFLLMSVVPMTIFFILKSSGGFNMPLSSTCGGLMGVLWAPCWWTFGPNWEACLLKNITWFLILVFLYFWIFRGFSVWSLSFENEKKM